MPLYEYKGINQKGRNVKGNIDSENIRTAKLRLKKDGIYVVQLRDKQKRKKAKKGRSFSQKRGINVDELSMMTRQLATLIKANIPLVDSLSALAEQIENPVLKEAISECKNMVNEGGKLHKSLAKYPKIFNNMYLSMIEAGEESGTLEVILLRLAEFTESQSELRAKVKSAMLYPIIMMIVTLGMIIFLFIYLIPKMVAIFDSAPELELGTLTLVVIGISEFIVNYWIVIGVSSFAASLVFFNWKRTPNGAAKWDAIVLKLPVIGEISRLVATSRFTRTLATLLNGGVPIITSLNIVRNVVDNHVLGAAIDNARNNITEGEQIAEPLRASKQFPPLVIHMIRIGEKTGELENMLIQVSDSYDFQVKNKIDGLTSILNPVMIVIMGIVIAIIVFAIMLPMFDMTNLG